MRRITAAVVAALAPTWAGAAGTSVYWDPSAADGIQGGGGIWNTSSSNWDNAGTRGQWNNSNNDTAVFSGTPGGTLQLSAAITAAGLQFDAAGYVIGAASSPTLTLSSGSVVANFDASVVAPLSTPAGLIKSGGGVLTLLGSSTIRGTVTILGGTVAFSAEAQLGITPHPIELSNGGLRYGGSTQLTLGAARMLLVDAAGGRIEVAAGALNLGAAGQLSGSGRLTKLGGQSLTISAANAGFTGTVEVGAGALVLQNAGAVNARPITLSGGSLLLRGNQTTDFQSDLMVSGEASLDVDRQNTEGMTASFHSVRDVSLAAGGKLTVTTSNQNYVSVRNLNLAGTLRLNDSAMKVTGGFSGTGGVTFGQISQLPELFTLGLIFANGASQTITNPISADDAVGGRPVIGVGAGTTLTYNGAWSGGGASVSSTVVLRDGATFILGPAARVNTTTADVTGVRPFAVFGNGVANAFELDAAMVADRTVSATVADGFSSLEVRDATLVTRASQGLPVIVKQDGFGGTHRAGSISFSGTSGARWTVATADQQYDGGIALNSSATVQADKDLTHSGTVAAKFDGSFQVPVAGVTLTKQGTAWLNLSGSQGYVAGSKLTVQGGGVRFDTDPGAGWYAGNYARGADGNVVSAPTPAGTLTIVAGGSAGAAVEFAAPVSRVDQLQVNAGGSARVTAGVLVTRTLIVSGGQVDLGSNRLIVDYDIGHSPLADVATMIKSGFNAGGPHWQGSGIVSGLAASNGAMGVGYAEAADVLEISGNQTGTFGGQSVDATSVLIRLTRLGDANLDGEVSFGDFQRFELGFGMAGQGWSGGDFNYDGKVDTADFKLLYDNFGKSADLPVGSAGVPEPTGLVMVGIAGMMLRRRRPAAGVRERL